MPMALARLSVENSLSCCCSIHSQTVLRVMLVSPSAAFALLAAGLAAQQAVDVGLRKLALRQQLRLLPVVAQRLLEAAELERFDQIIHHPVVQRFCTVFTSLAEEMMITSVFSPSSRRPGSRSSPFSCCM